MVDGGGGASDLLVIFGITGDLARKMTFRALYRLERHQLLDCPILGVASDDMSVGQLVKWARESIGRTEKIDDAVFDRLAGRLSYLHGDVTDSQLYDSLAELISSACRPLYYLEMPPALFAPIVEKSRERAAVGARTRCRGKAVRPRPGLRARTQRPAASGVGRRPNPACGPLSGQAARRRAGYLRFANQALAELWDRNSISEIHITMAEDFGVEDRGKFYDAVGALRDVVQNHLLQVLALVTMEPPVGSSADDLNDKKAEVFRAMAPLDPDRCVRGQYLGYTEVAGVASDSATETYVALRTEIDNWRWAGVPIFVRAGKELPAKVTEVRLFLRRVPALAFLPNRRPAEPNQIVLRIDPDPGMRLQISAHTDDSWRDIHLDSSFAVDLGEPIRPYERLLYAGLVGDHQLFAREDSIEQTWRIVQPLLDNPGEIHRYDRGSWGPEAAQSLLRGHRGWQSPWLPRGTDA